MLLNIKIKRLMDIIDATDANGQAEVAREEIKRLAAVGAVNGALHGKELHCLALRLANHGELTRLGVCFKLYPSII